MAQRSQHSEVSKDGSGSDEWWGTTAGALKEVLGDFGTTERLNALRTIAEEVATSPETRRYVRDQLEGAPENDRRRARVAVAALALRRDLYKRDKPKFQKDVELLASWLTRLSYTPNTRKEAWTEAERNMYSALLPEFLDLFEQERLQQNLH